jgi:hypothetical protein
MERGTSREGRVDGVAMRLWAALQWRCRGAVVRSDGRCGPGREFIVEASGLKLPGVGTA